MREKLRHAFMLTPSEAISYLFDEPQLRDLALTVLYPDQNNLLASVVAYRTLMDLAGF